MTEMSRLVVVNEWTGNYAINESYRPIAEALAMKFDELKHIAVTDIIFIDNNEGKGKHKNKIKYAQIGKLPDKWQQIIKQLTGRSFYYFIEIFKTNTRNMNREQIVALIYHELRHIGRDGEIVLHDIEDWVNMHYQLGSDWADARRIIPDLLQDGVNWDNITVPRLFDEPRLKVLKSSNKRVNR